MHAAHYSGCRPAPLMMLASHQSMSNPWCYGVRCECSITRSDGAAFSSACVKRHYSICSSAVPATFYGKGHSVADQRACKAYSNGNSSSSRDTHDTDAAVDSTGTGGGSGSWRGSGGDSGGDGSSGSDPAGNPKLPTWYKVWMWATAFTYLVWRWKWRKDRKEAAEQFAKEQQIQEQLHQEWQKFSQRYSAASAKDEHS